MNHIKQPGERRIYEIDFADLLGGETIAETSDLSQQRRELVDEVEPIGLDATAFDATRVRVTLSGGTDGETYLVTARVVDTAGQTHESSVEIQVADIGFTLPDGASTPYLTGPEYVQRFGLAETVKLTDQTRTGTIDRNALAAALTDASAYAEAALIARYALPLATVPAVLKTIVADLARERLHGDKPTPAVTERADRARSDLRDIAKGVLRLPLPSGAPVEAAPTSGGVQFVAGGRAFTDDALRGF